MARIFHDTCGDHYTFAQSNLVWDFPAGVGSIASGIPGATGKCMFLQWNSPSLTDSYQRKNLPTSYTTLIYGERYQPIGLPISGYKPIMSFWDNGTLQSNLRVDSSGRLSFWLGSTSSGTQIGGFTPGALVKSSEFVHIQVSVVASTTGTGSWEIRVNSQSVATAAGVTTAVTTGGFNQVSIHGGDSNFWSGCYHDDVYLNSDLDDGTGTCMGFDGDQQILLDQPAAAGASTQWSIGGATPAATNWESVNGASPDATNKFVYAPSTGLVDLYKINTLPTNVISIPAVQSVLAVNTDTSGLGSGAGVAPVFGDGGLHTAYVGSTVFLNTTVNDFSQAFGKNPITNAAWTLSDFNTATTANRLQIGIKRIT